MGSGTGGANRGYTLTANITQSTNDPANNRTYVYTSLVLNCTNNYFQQYSASGGYYINGSAAAYWSGQYSMPSNYSSITLGTWEGWIGHDANGNGTITVSGDFDTAASPSYLPDYVSVSYSESLPNYDRSPNAPTMNYSTRDAAGTTITVVSNATSAKNSGPAITDYNFIYSTDNATWSAAQAMGTDLTGAFTGGKTTNYYVASRAYNSDGWSGYGTSKLFYGFPTAPQSLTAAGSSSVSGRVNLSWTTPSSTNGGITGYKIYRKLSTDASFSTTPVATTTGTGTTYSDDGLSRGVLYDYKIAARNAVSDVPGSQSDYSNTVTSVMAPGVPTAPTLSTVVASTDTFGKVTLTWEKPTNTVGGIVDYYLYADGVLKTSVSGENTLTGAITGLNERQTYSFTVRARNQYAVDNGLTGDTSNAISRKAPGPPSAPLSLTSSAPFFPPGTIDLSWTAPTDVGTEGGTITGYSIYLAGSSTPVLTTTGTGTTATVPDLIPATAYTFNVRARNAIADTVGTFSVASNSTTSTAQGEPDAPTNFTVSPDPIVAGRLILTWTPPAGYNTGFRVYTGADVLVANIATPRLEIDGLTPGTSYSYKVRARNPLTDLTNSDGGPFSATVSGTAGSSSAQTTPSTAVANTTNATFVGTYPIVSSTATTFSYSKTASAIPFATVPTGAGSTVNNTNTNLNGTYTLASTTSTAMTFNRDGSDIVADTATPGGTVTDHTNAIFNGDYTVSAADSPTKTVSYSKVSSNISSRAASGTVTNNSNAVYNGVYEIKDITNTEIIYDQTNADIPEAEAFGTVYNKTNTDIFNGQFTLTDTPDYRTVEYSTNDLVYGENLITNPSFEYVQSGSTTLRINLCSNPSFETNVTGWSGTNASIARSSSHSYSGSYSGLVTPGSTSGSVATTSTTVSGQAHVLSVWVYAEEATTVRLSVVSPATTGATTTIPADTWTRLSLSFTSNTTSTAYAVETVGSTQPFYLDSVLLEQTSELRPYFDGGTTDALGWDYGWTGTANASTSTAKAKSAARTNLLGNPSFEAGTTYWYTDNSTIAQSSAYSKVGTYSLLATPSTNVGGATFSVTLPFVSETYTISAWVYATTTKNIQVVLGPTSSSVTAVPANTWTRVSLVVTASGVTFPSIRGTDSTTPFYIDAVMVELGSSVNDYIEGSVGAVVPIPVGLSTVSSDIVSTYARSHSGSLSALVSPTANTGGASLTQTTVAGTVYTFSAWVYAASAKNMKLSADSTVGTTVAVPATTWTRLSLTFTAEDTSTLLSVLGTDSTTAFYLDDVMLEASSTASAYFDGDTDAAANTWPVVYSWAGTPHASVSVREVGGTLPTAGAELLLPYGTASRVASDAHLQIQYRSGWLG